MAVVKSFELNGNKQSFASWISMLSPCDTPFTSMIGKEGITQTQYSWQTDALAPADNSTYEEGSQVASQIRASTKEFTNFTSILRKAVSVSDTAEKVSTHGRASELAYQMSKAGKEILRDLEWMNLSHVNGNIGSGTLSSKFAGFEGLVGGTNVPDSDTGAIVHKEAEFSSSAGAVIDKDDIFDLTYNLYLAGSKANKIMFHPKHAFSFSALVSKDIDADGTFRMFEGLGTTFNAQVKTIRDPLGQVYTLIPNRHVPVDKIYFFNEADWTQMILRAPTRTKLAKDGSSEKHMIEMEVGLRHKHPYASGILTLVTSDIKNTLSINRTNFTAGIEDTLTTVRTTVTVNGVGEGNLGVLWHTSNPQIARWKDSSNTTGAATGRATNQLIAGSEVGTATVWCTSRGVKSDVFTINVMAPVLELLVNNDRPTINEEVTLEALVKKYDGSLAGSGITLRWSANPPSDIELSALSSVTISGLTTITGKVLKDTPIIVQAAVNGFSTNNIALNGVIIPTDIQLQVNPTKINHGEGTILSAVVTDGLGLPILDAPVSWESDVYDVQLPGVTKTNAQGVATAQYTPSNNSEYRLTASVGGIRSNQILLEVN